MSRGLFSTCLEVIFLCVWGVFFYVSGGLFGEYLGVYFWCLGDNFYVFGGNFAGGLKKKVLKGREDKMSREDYFLNFGQI